MNIVFYVSGHGYGHATRSGEVIRAIGGQSTDVQIHVRCNVSAGIFLPDSDRRIHHTAVNLDVGTVQKDSFQVDKQATLKQVQQLYARRKAVISRELRFINRIRADLLVADVPPLAFDIAEAAGVPSIALANFSWDWIYRAYLDEFPAFQEVIHQVSASYRKADVLLRLPFYGDLSVFKKIVDIPLVGRKAKKSKSLVLQKLGFSDPAGKKLVLVAFRATDLQRVDLQRLESWPEYLFITIGTGGRFRNQLNLEGDVPEFTDILNACDAVVSKPGYGLVSEVIANRTPLLFTERKDFPEYEVLTRGLRTSAVAKFMPLSDFFSGNWGTHLSVLLARPADWPRVACDGAQKAAELILNKLTRRETR